MVAEIGDMQSTVGGDCDADRRIEQGICASAVFVACDAGPGECRDRAVGQHTNAVVVAVDEEDPAGCIGCNAPRSVQLRVQRRPVQRADFVCACDGADHSVVRDSPQCIVEVVADVDDSLCVHSDIIWAVDARAGALSIDPSLGAACKR